MRGSSRQPMTGRAASEPLAQLRQTAASVPLMLWLVALLLLAFAVRVIRLGAFDLWLDEAISFFISNKSFGEIIRYTASRPWEHPPGYYLLLHLWITLAGSSEFSLRFLSVIGGMLAVSLSVALARRWFGNRLDARAAGLLAILVVLIMLLQPMAVQVAREARMYAWMMALALLTVLSLDRAFRYNRWRDWALFLLFTGAAVAFHYMAGLLLAAYALFLVLFWRRLPAGKIWLAAILLVIFGLGAAWVLTQPGPRSMMDAVLAQRLRVPVLLADFFPVFTHWAIGNWAYFIPIAPAILLGLLIWAPAVIGIAGTFRRRQASSEGRQRAGTGLAQNRAVVAGLVITLLLVPPVVRAVVHVVRNERHSAMVIGVLAVAAAVGIVLILRRSRAAGLALLAALVVSNVYLFARDLSAVERPFSAATDYVQARAGSTEPIVYTHPYDWPQDLYYNHRGLTPFYIPWSLDAVPVDVAKARLIEVLGDARSAWLILYPSVLQPENVEQAFNELAFPGEKVWFPGGRAAIHYFTADVSASGEAGTMQSPGGQVWGAVKLNRWGAAGQTVPAGDALRLQFEWQRVAPLTDPAVVLLNLVGPDGTVWAKRAGPPCNGYCPASDWGDEPVAERVAFEVPADVPPGDYEVRAGWTTEDGAAVLGHRPGSSVLETSLPLATVTITEPVHADVASAPLPKELNAAMGPGLVLTSAEFGAPSLQPGKTLAIPTQWRVEAAQPALDLQLKLEMGSRQAQIVQPLGPAWYPASAWLPGRTVRGQNTFSIPGDLPGGTYRATLAVVEEETGTVRGEVPLGSLHVVERPHSFELPDIGSPADASWQGGVHLARVQVPERATAGTPAEMTFVWQAGDPTQRNWKVFIHLEDTDGVVRAQGDAYPMGGAALTPSWQKGEVLADTYSVPLLPGMPGGAYTVRLGFYDETTGERLPLADGSDSFVLPAPLIVDAGGRP